LDLKLARGFEVVVIQTWNTERVLLNAQGAEFTHVDEGGLVSFYDPTKNTGTRSEEFDRELSCNNRVAELLAEGYSVVTEAEFESILDNAPLPVLPEPPAGMIPGTFAYTAWFMAQSGMMTGDEADRWKDQMKDGY
jgi:hypothetical protein